MPNEAVPADATAQAVEQIKWIDAARMHWKPIHLEIAQSRKQAQGKVRDDEGKLQKVNLAMSTLQALMPHIYARNPEIAGTPKDSVREDMVGMVRDFGEVSAHLVNQMYDEAGLKSVARRALRSALSAKCGWAKQIWQSEYKTDPIQVQRIEDSQDELARMRQSIERLEGDGYSQEDTERRAAELEQQIAASEKNRETLVANGLSLTTVAPEMLILDPAISSIDDWRRSRRIVELIPMPKEEAEERCSVRLTSATPRGYNASTTLDQSGRAGSDVQLDPMVLLMEMWDHRLRTCFTFADGMPQWVREPYQPQYASEIWYPWRPLYFHLPDGAQFPDSLLELLSPLFKEYNDVREAQREHRRVSKPHWIASSETPENSLRRYTDAEVGEIVIVDAQGKPLNQVIQRAEPPAYDPRIYDTVPIRHDINELSGLQDAARGAVSTAKTATEAEILQQGLAGRADTARDESEDWLSNLAVDGLQLATQAMSQDAVGAIVGPDLAVVWGAMVSTRRNLYESINLKVRAGSTGKPNAVREQQTWSEIMPRIMEIQTRIRELVAMEMSPEPEIEVLRETIRRLGEHIEVEPYIPPEALIFLKLKREMEANPAPVAEPGVAPEPGVEQPPPMQLQ